LDGLNSIIHLSSHSWSASRSFCRHVASATEEILSPLAIHVCSFIESVFYTDVWLANKPFYIIYTTPVLHSLYANEQTAFNFASIQSQNSIIHTKETGLCATVSLSATSVILTIYRSRAAPPLLSICTCNKKNINAFCCCCCCCHVTTAV